MPPEIASLAKQRRSAARTIEGWLSWGIVIVRVADALPLRFGEGGVMPITPLALPLGNTERPVPVWVLRLAKALPFIVLPHCLWRLPFAVDFRMGSIDPAAPTVAPWWVPFYVVGLSVLTEALALLTTGLVSGWGEVVPRWVPFLGGRRVAPLAAVIPAVLGGLALVAMFDLYPLAWAGVLPEVGFSNGWWMALARVCITPAMLWGPIVLALAWAYYHRRRPA